MAVFCCCNPAKSANLLGKPCMGMADVAGSMQMVMRTWRNGGTMQGGGKCNVTVGDSHGESWRNAKT